MAFLRDFAAFNAGIGHRGMSNGLAQTLLKISSPGSPETSIRAPNCGNLRLVYPYNRQPVDFASAFPFWRLSTVKQCIPGYGWPGHWSTSQSHFMPFGNSLIFGARTESFFEGRHSRIEN